MANKFNQITIASQLADAMIEEIKSKELIKPIAEMGDDTKDFFDSIVGIFGLKLCTLLLEYAKNDLELQKEMEADEETLEEFETLKKLFNSEGEG